MCPEVHESLVSGSDGTEGEPDEGLENERVSEDESGRPNPFAALEKLKQGGPGDKKH